MVCARLPGAESDTSPAPTSASPALVAPPRAPLSIDVVDVVAAAAARLDVGGVAAAAVGSAGPLAVAAGAGVLEGWTHYVWHYVTAELPGRVR